MSGSKESDERDARVLLKAADVLAHRWRSGKRPADPAPDAVVLCFSRSLLRHLTKRHRVKRLDGFLGELYLLKAARGEVGVMGNFGIGAPVVAALVEELAAFGARRFVSIGLAGGLQPDLHPGDVVLCDRAIRDEGTSTHYLPPARYVEADRGFVERLVRSFAAQELVHSLGASWTTDAPYRETLAEVERCQQEAVKTVDMEAAALFAVGQHLGVETAAVFVVSDSLADLRWQPAADARKPQNSLQRVLDAVIDALAGDG